MIKSGSVRYDNRGRKLPDGISQRKNGLYQIRITVDGKQWVRYHKDLGEAKKILRQKQSEIAEGSISNLESLSLNDYYDKWLRIYKKHKLKQRTLNNYIGYYNKNIREAKIGKMKLEDIRQIHIVNHFNALADREEKPLAHSTLVYINCMIGGCLQQAVADGLIKNNPAIGVMKHVNGRGGSKRIAYTGEQEQIFLEYISNGRYAMYKNLFITLFRTGARIGEVCSLTWDDIDFDRGMINIDKSVNYDKLDKGTKKQFYITPPKTGSSIRKVPMMSLVKEALLEQKEYQKQFEINNSYEVPRYDKDKKYIGMCSGFVFTTSKGTIPTNESLNRTVRAIINAYNKDERKRAKEDKRNEKLLPFFTLHCTRHTFATQAYSKKMRGLSISATLGHSSEETTKKIYTHADFDILKADMEEAWGA
ncbi:MAG: site-specific integrase [Lachnospiraceae bacterium]|nr:site-specific integrase [Lachnospiraceae bacterium]